MKFLLRCLFQTANDGNTTISTLTFIPIKEDDGKKLSCRAENKALSSDYLEDSWKLVIHCKLPTENSPFLLIFRFTVLRKNGGNLFLSFNQTIKSHLEFRVSDTPEARIKLGISLNPNAVREGNDVYFDCIINAHPPAYKVEWRHNVSKDNRGVMLLSSYTTDTRDSGVEQLYFYLCNPGFKVDLRKYATID